MFLSVDTLKSFEKSQMSQHYETLSSIRDYIKSETEILCQQVSSLHEKINHTSDDVKSAADSSKVSHTYICTS